MQISLPLWQIRIFIFFGPQETIPTLFVTVSVWNADNGDPHPLPTVYVIFVVPALIAVTKPVVAFTVAIPLLVELHAPPAVPVLLYVAVAPIGRLVIPLTTPADTFGLTVSIVEALTVLHEPVTVYIILVVPAFTAVTIPVDEFTVANDVFELLQLPPGVPLLVYVEICPIHSGDRPLTTPALTAGFAVNVISFDVAKAGLAQPSDDVITTVTTSPFTKVEF